MPTAGLPLDDLLAIALLVFFGVQTLRSAATADTTAAEEKEEAQEVVDGFGSGETRFQLHACVAVWARGGVGMWVCGTAARLNLSNAAISLSVCPLLPAFPQAPPR